MSQLHRDFIRQNSKQRGSKRAVLNILADHANDEGIAALGNDFIAEDIGSCTRTVMRALEALCEAGEIEAVSGGLGRGNFYQWRIVMPEKVTTGQTEKGDNVPSGEEKVTNCQVLENEKGDNPTPLEPEKGDNVSRKGDKLSPFGGDYRGGSFENILNNKLTTSSGEDAAQPPDGKKVSEHQQMFEKICDIVGWDWNILDERGKGQVAQTLGFLKKGAYTLEDLNRFGKDVWAHDWRWEKNKQRPTLTQLRQEIGKLRAKGFHANGTTQNGDSFWAQAFANQDIPEYIRDMQAGGK